MCVHPKIEENQKKKKKMFLEPKNILRERGLCDTFAYVAGLSSNN